MGNTRRWLGFVLLGAGAWLVAGPTLRRAEAAAVAGQEQAPNRREFTIVARDFEFAPRRIEVTQNDLVTLTIRSEDDVHSFAIDGYRIMKRVPAGGSVTFDFRADKAGTFAFYCGMTNDDRHGRMKGELVVVAR